MWCSEVRIRPPIRVPCLPAAVFLRHTPDSPVVNLVAKIRELTSKAVPDLDYERVSVMLVPVREQVSVPMEPTPKFLGLPIAPENGRHMP